MMFMSDAVMHITLNAMLCQVFVNMYFMSDTAVDRNVSGKVDDLL